MSKRLLLLLTMAVLCLGTFASADVFTIIPDRATQNPSDIIDWTQLGPDFTVVGTPALVFTANGYPALVGNVTGAPFARVDAGNSWQESKFDFGESLVWTGGGGPFLMQLGQPVNSVGFGIEPDQFGLFTAIVSLYDPSANLLGTFSFNGDSPVCDPNCYGGDEMFVGIADHSGNNIGFILIDTTTAAGISSDFAIDDPSFTYVPEPGSLVLLGSGLIGVAGLVRRKMGR